MNKLFFAAIFGALLLNFACAPFKIYQKPIVFDEQRMQLTKEYMMERYGFDSTTTGTINPKMVVLHWTAIPTLKKSYAAFEKSTLPNWRPEITSAGSLNVSAHFLVDKNGKVYQLMPDTLMARHVIGLNHCAIGVENVGGVDGKPLSARQKRANVKLIEHLKEKYPIEYVIGHYEYTHFESHPLWLEKDSAYRTSKTDPGEKFMKKVRKQLKDYDFKTVPQKNEK